VLGDAVLEVTGETDPCERMEEAQAGLFQALAPEWRGGVTCRVIANGTIHVGMDIQLLAPAP
jgi:MOSC domain-containing protein YiiM